MANERYKLKYASGEISRRPIAILDQTTHKTLSFEEICTLLNSYDNFASAISEIKDAAEAESYDIPVGPGGKIDGQD